MKPAEKAVAQIISAMTRPTSPAQVDALIDAARTAGTPETQVAALIEYKEALKAEEHLKAAAKDAKQVSEAGWDTVHQAFGDQLDLLTERADVVDMSRNNPPPSNAERVKSREFSEGRAAFAAGKSALENPYEMGSESWTCWGLGNMAGEYKGEGAANG